MSQIVTSSTLKGFLGTSSLLAFYFTTVTLISGPGFAQSQFAKYWYFILSLAFGFGIQVGLYTYLKKLIQGKNNSGKVLAASGATSTAAMVSCCAHYLVNLLPILGAVGIITVISQYQVELFWVGLTFNFAGIVYITGRIYRFSKGL